MVSQLRKKVKETEIAACAHQVLVAAAEAEQLCTGHYK